MANTYKYRADHIGKLVAAVTASETGPEAALKLLLSMQKSSGVAIASDGEVTRQNLAEALAARGAGGGAPRIYSDEAVPTLKLATMPVKVSLPTPSAALVYLARSAKGPFDREASAEALATAIRAEAVALIQGGVPYIQFDGSAYADALEDNNSAFDSLLALDQRVLASISAPPEARIALRIGQRHAMAWKTNARTAALLSLPAHRFLLTFFGEPADFSILASVRSDADIVLGLIDNTMSQGADALLNQIDGAAKIVDGDRLALSPQDGFSGAGQAAWDAQRRVLEQVADVATRWWGFAI